MDLSLPSADRPSPRLPHLGLLGVPLDLGGAVAGTLMGPAALRTAGRPGARRARGHRVTYHGDLAPAALADIPVPPGRHGAAIAAWTVAIHDRTLDLLEAGQVPILLGGDHAMSMGSVSAVARHCAATGRDLAVLWLDAHADFTTPSVSTTGNLHGMPVAFLCREPSLAALLPGRPFPPLAPARTEIFGLRSVDAAERRRLAACGIGCTDMRAIDEFGLAPMLRRSLGRLDPARTHLHVSFDLDIVDPALAPGVGTAVPGGLTFREAHLVMEMLHESGLVGSLDLVELNPFLDERGRSARLLADLAASLFGQTVLVPAGSAHAPA